MYNFDFVRPSSIEEAVAAIAAEEAQALGGGQTLIPTLRQRLASPSVLVSLTGIAEMKGISREGDALVIGGGTTHGEIAAQTDYPALAYLASRIGDPAVRNRGTIGGSLANNDPAACYPAALLASGGTVVTNAREITAEDYFQGMFTTARWRDHHEGALAGAAGGQLPEVRATGLALPAGGGVRGETRLRRARGGDRRLQ